MKRRIALGAALVCCSLMIGAAAGTFAVVRDTGDRVQILGSGDAVSVLVTSEQSQLLLATGTDRTAFGNAIDRVTRGPGNGPDIIVVAGSGDQLTASVNALELFEPGRAYALHPIDASELGDPTLARLQPLPTNPVRITLADRVVIMLESIPLPDADDSYAWRATVTLNSSRIAVVSESSHLSFFDWSYPPSALIIAGDIPSGPVDPVGANVIIAAATALDPTNLDLQDSKSRASGATYVVPVRPGDVATLTFGESGLTLTSDDRITEITPTAVSNARQPNSRAPN